MKMLYPKHSVVECKRCKAQWLMLVTGEGRACYACGCTKGKWIAFYGYDGGNVDSRGLLLTWTEMEA